MVGQACEALRADGNATADGFVDYEAVKSNVSMRSGEEVTSESLDLVCETEGNAQNGGGAFESRVDGDRRLIRWTPGLLNESAAHHHLGTFGDIGSPVIGAGHSGFGRAS